MRNPYVIGQLLKEHSAFLNQIENKVRVAVTNAGESFVLDMILKPLKLTKNKYYRRKEDTNRWTQDELMKLLTKYPTIYEVEKIDAYYNLLLQIENKVREALTKKNKEFKLSHILEPLGISKSAYYRRKEDTNLWEQDEINTLVKTFNLSKEHI